MSEFEQFDVRSEAEISGVISISDAFLPMVGEPVVGIDQSLSNIRSYEWSKQAEGAAIFMVARSVHMDGLDKLSAIAVYENYSTGVVTSTRYQLNVQNGRFLVTREMENAASPIARTDEEQNAHQIKEAEELEFELGLLKPDTDDWKEFVGLLLAGGLAKQNAERMAQKRTLASRLSRLRSFFGQ